MYSLELLIFLCVFIWIVDQLKSVNDLLSSWQKMELNSWPALLDEVMDQYENNAAKVSDLAFHF